MLPLEVLLSIQLHSFHTTENVQKCTVQVHADKNTDYSQLHGSTPAKRFISQLDDYPAYMFVEIIYR